MNTKIEITFLNGSDGYKREYYIDDEGQRKLEEGSYLSFTTQMPTFSETMLIHVTDELPS